MTTLLELSSFAGWLASGERGISSEAIVSHLTGEPVGRNHGLANDYPYDPGDFRRCELLLRAVPIARPFFPALEHRSRPWAALVANWAEIVELMETEAPGCFTGGYRGGSAPKAYARMDELIRTARQETQP